MAGNIDGFFDVPSFPYNTLGAGAFSEVGAILPPSGQVFYVRGNGTTVTEYSGDAPGIRERLNASVQVALRQCVANRGDKIIVLPGHTENLATADSWSNIVAGVEIIGVGRGTLMPKFTFTTAGSTLAIDVANVTIRGCRFLCAGPAGSTALTVAVAFVVTAAGFNFVGNICEVGIDADQLCTDMMTLSAAADDCTIARNYIYGALAAEITSVVTTAGAVDRLKIFNNIISAAVVTAATGVLLDLDNAALLENDIIGNHLENKTASSKFVIDPHATSTGIVDGNRYYVGDGGTGPASLGFATFTTTYKFGLNYCVTAVSVSAILCPAADA